MLYISLDAVLFSICVYLLCFLWSLVCVYRWTWINGVSFFHPFRWVLLTLLPLASLPCLAISSIDACCPTLSSSAVQQFTSAVQAARSRRVMSKSRSSLLIIQLPVRVISIWVRTHLQNTLHLMLHEWRKKQMKDVKWLDGGLTDWLAGGLTDWLAGGLTDWFIIIILLLFITCLISATI